MNIGIIGHGYVGLAVHELFRRRHAITVHDPEKYPGEDRIKRLNNHADFIFVCVPTPMSDDGSCDTSIVDTVCRELAPKDGAVVVLKSTVAPHTTQGLAHKYELPMAFSPEYAGESSYWSSHKFHADMRETPFYIFGGPRELTTKCVELYKPICGPEKRYLQTDSTTAELVKYAENSFYATKIMFCYEFANIAKSFGADWNEVRELWLADPRINPMHTAVFPANPRPFGGKCLPKDLSAIIEAGVKAGGCGPAGLLAKVRELNNCWVSKEEG
jgi:UDPglucose 6-dehydrogenase